MIIMIIIYDPHIWCSCTNITHHHHVCTSYRNAIYDPSWQPPSAWSKCNPCMWSSHMSIMIYDPQLWSSYRIIEYCYHTPPTHMIIKYDYMIPAYVIIICAHHILESYMIIVYDDHTRRINFIFNTNYFGDRHIW